ncbi:RHS repeat-associated core domain-containing protein [Rhodanobacter sp. OK091]|uniref:RHS repeat-associated core domain-containing protein n=1 Tax=Rhodanobacter sp. OK091 TaxID=1881037 RepID=UPI000921FE5A|nr:RHS repeat-associated core domain-containing protein [Rhodanobacter sp. OK091]SHL58189.1 RHS repeat-associated core domain-containing protein [Rhodanobacter sp. OK091]
MAKDVPSTQQSTSQGNQMDFVRCVLLVLCVSVCGVGSASVAGEHAGNGSPQPGPARTSSSHGTPTAVGVGVPLSPSAATTATNFQSSTVSYYGAPFHDDYAYHNDGYSESVEAALAKWWAQYQLDWAYAFPGCSYAPSYDGAGPQTGHFASFYLQGTCGGGGSIYGTAYPYIPGKNNGPTCHCAGDPINLGTGNEYRDEADNDLGSLSFHRYYNSHAAVATSHIGAHWRHSFDRSLEYLSSGTTSIATVFRPDGMQVVFTLQNGQWTTDPDVADHLTTQTNGTGVIIGWLYADARTRYQEAYDAKGNLLSITDTHGQVTTLAYSTASTPTSMAPSAGLLLTVTDPRGRSLSFTYNAQGNVATATQPDGGVLGYAYDTNGNLVTVTYPDTKTRQYVYNESTLTGGTSLRNALTGDIDESGNRLTSVGYNSLGQATMSTLPGGVDLTQVVYNSNSTTSVTYPTGAQATFSFVVPNGSMHASTVSAPCGPGCGQPNAAATFDSNGYAASTTDFNGNVTTMVHDANGLLDQQVDGSGSTAQRTTNTTWDTTLRVPLTRTVLDASGNAVTKTSWVYNTLGQPLARCEIDPAQASSYTCATTGTPPAGVRRWTYSYCTAVDTTQCPIVGLLLAVDGPRTDVSDVTTYAYYLTDSSTAHHGDLQSVTDALGHTTAVLTYDGAGRVTRLQDANGVVTNLTYTPRGWLASRSVGGATTTLSYTPFGAIASITDPDGITTSYTYDAAHRLTDITDAQGNVIHYTLDAAGNKTAEQIRTASGTVVHSLSRTYNTLGQLTALVDGLNQTVFNAGTSGSYDANGNLVQSADALGIQSHQGFDALNRLQSTIANYNGTDPATKNTQSVFAYDARDHVEGISDPDGLSTTYDYDGLGNRTALHSPDTGTTSRTFDAAGNVLTKTDAKGVVAINTYDALDRLITSRYPDSTQNITYSYDDPNSITLCNSSNPIGRLTRILENTVTTAYCYDTRGHVITKIENVNGTSGTISYTYTAAGRLASVTVPPGMTVSYAYDTDGRINQITSNWGVQVSSVTWLPFGPLASYTLGNGQVVARTYDANYRLTDLTSSAFNLHVARDALGDITAIGSNPGANPATEAYSYDPLRRLTAVTEASGTVLESLTYNQTGDRLSKSRSGSATGTYQYNTGTHQLIATGNAARTVDANANTTAVTDASGTYGFGYSGRNRMTVAQLGGTTVGSYLYNALGQRVYKSAGGVARLFAYDEAGHLIGDYLPPTSGVLNDNFYVWLGDVPVAAGTFSVSNGQPVTSVNYVIADELGTPRAVSNSAGTMIWSWAYQGNPFGELPPTSTTGYVLNLRYPGQYYDVETGLMYNGARYYEPGTGRFPQSDPMGLFGGQISTYAYGNNDPLSNIDPSGLGCSVSGGFVTCAYPGGGPAFRLPAPSAFPASLGPNDFWYHKYDVTRPIGCADPNDVMQGLINNPTPGNPNPATPGGTPNNAAVPVVAPNNPVTSYLTSDLNTGAPIVVNITGANSAFGPGYVARTVTDGVAHTYGEGDAWTQSALGGGIGPNWAANQYIWGGQMSQIIAQSKQQCGCTH